MNKRLKSFQYALAGLWTLIKTQPNARIHLLATLVVVLAGGWIGLSGRDWLWITIAIVLVWAAEAFNTALELLADAVHPDHHPLIQRAKDVAAAAVLISAIGAAVMGAIIFLPRLF